MRIVHCQSNKTHCVADDFHRGHSSHQQSQVTHKGCLDGFAIDPCSANLNPKASDGGAARNRMMPNKLYKLLGCLGPPKIVSTSTRTSPQGK